MNILFSSFFLIGIYLISKKINKKIFNIQDPILNSFTCTAIIISIYLILAYLFIFKYNTNLASVTIFIFFFAIGLINIIKNNKNIINTYKKNIKRITNISNLFLIILISLYFFSAFLPASDIDSMRYHLEIPKRIIEGNFYNNITLDYALLGPNEIINLFGLNLFFENSASILNFFYLFLLINSNYFLYLKYNIGTKYFGSLLIASSPIFISSITSQKITTLPIYILVYVLVYILLNKNILKFKVNLLLSSISIFAVAVKSIFFPFVLFIFGSQIYYLKNNSERLFLTSLYIFFSIVIFFPIFLLKYKIFSDPFLPFFSINETNLNWFLHFKDYLISYDVAFSIKNLILLPFKFLIPFSTNNFTFEYGSLFKILGFGFLGIFFINYKLKNFMPTKLILLSLLCSFLIGNLQTRWFLPFFLLIAIFYSNKNSYHNILKKFIFVQSIFVMLILFLISVSSIVANFNNDYKKIILNKIAYGYEFTNSVRKKYPNHKIFSVIENFYYMENYVPIYFESSTLMYDKNYFSKNVSKNEKIILIYNRKRHMLHNENWRDTNRPLNMEELKNLLKINNLQIINIETKNIKLSGRFFLSKKNTYLDIYELLML